MSKRSMAAMLVCVLVLSMLAAYGENPQQATSAAAWSADSQSYAGPQDYIQDTSEVTHIVLDGNSATADGEGVTVDSSQVRIVSAGTYDISGSLADGQVVVDTEEEGTVTLILNGVDIRNSTGAPLYVAQAQEALIVLQDNTENRVADGAAYVFEDATEDEPNAAIFSKSDLTIAGSGTLTVEAAYKDGIVSKDGLTIAGGTITVSAVDDGLRGKDYLVVNDGTITVNAGRDGLKADNAEDATQGYITIKAGIFHITSGGDALQAETALSVSGGDFTLVSGGGSGNRIDANTSAKAIKAGVSVTLEGGTFTIDSADDALHSNDSIVINGGTFTIATGDDALHADATLEINGGDITITKSYEGLESAVITINGGNVRIVSSDDGVNVVGENDGSGMMAGPGRDGAGGGRMPGQGSAPGQGTVPGQGGMPGQDAFAAESDQFLTIHGGLVVIDAVGDGMDVNGAIEMTGGVVIVNGPTDRMNSALDYNHSFTITGGFLVAVGSSGMAQGPTDSSTQNSVLLNFNGALPAGTLIHIQTSAGEELLTFSPTKDYESIVFSSPELTTGLTYDVYYGGSSTGSVEDGLIQGGAYDSGTQYTSFTVSSPVTKIGSMGGRW
ncbi:MAG: carbohydrate-binding domain-containing protein [Anaerolineae bacterium]|nr:carbohydrate-binding domain-containing protein [Anaerolineae bacterium]